MDTQKLKDNIISWRRDFHQYPETGFLEMRTASIAASILDELGFDLKLGKEVISAKDCRGKPGEKITEQHYEWAMKNGAIRKYIDHFSEGYTGITATMDTGKPGPTIAFRFDMDALDIDESASEDH